MPKVHREGSRSLVGQEFYEVEEVVCWSFCPDSNDASTPATQVHMHMTLSSPLFGVSLMVDSSPANHHETTRRPPRVGDADFAPQPGAVFEKRSLLPRRATMTTS